MNFILKKLSEPSSWAGLGSILAVVGLNLDAELLQHIAAVGAVLAGAIGFILDEKGAA